MTILEKWEKEELRRTKYFFYLDKSSKRLEACSLKDVGNKFFPQAKCSICDKNNRQGSFNRVIHLFGHDFPNTRFLYIKLFSNLNANAKSKFQHKLNEFNEHEIQKNTQL